VLQCRSKKNGADWNRAVTEECLTIATAVATGDDVPFCSDPKSTIAGSYSCNVAVNEEQHHFNGVTCQLECPIGYRLKREDFDRKTCHCSIRGCKWTNHNAVSCVFDKHILRAAEIWGKIKEMSSADEQLAFIKNYFKSLSHALGKSRSTAAVAATEMKEILFERAAERKAERARLGKLYGQKKYFFSKFV